MIKKISVIVPVYNSVSKIKRCLDSILNQTYRNIEIILVNDGSTDDSLSILNDYSNRFEQIHVLNLDMNSGVAEARNAGIRHSSGDYIAFLDSDDEWLNDKISTQLSFMEETNAKFSYSNFRVVSDTRIKELIFDDCTDYVKLLKTNSIGCSTVMIKSEIMKKFPMKNIGHEDYLSWLEITKSGVVAFNCKQVLTNHYTSGNSLSGNKVKAARWQWEIYRNKLNLSIAESLYYFMYYSINGLIKKL